MKSFTRLFLGFLAGFSLFLPGFATEAKAENEPFTAIYDFYIGGLPVAEISLEGAITSLGYNATSNVKTRGLLELLVSARMSADAEGYRHAMGHLSPDVYSTSYTTRSEARKVEIAYSGEIGNVSITPPEEKKSFDTNASAHPGTLDPVTAAVTMMNPQGPEQLCNRTIPVFDGKRRYDIVLLPQNRRPAGKSAPAPSWNLPTTRCFGVYERIAGFEGELQGAQRYFPFDIWFEQDKEKISRIVRLAGKTKLGFAIGTLRR